MDVQVCAECGEATGSNMGRPHSAWKVPLGQGGKAVVLVDFAGKGGRPVLCKGCVRKVVDRGLDECGL
jgi:hypothetical protein